MERLHWAAQMWMFGSISGAERLLANLLKARDIISSLARKQWAEGKALCLSWQIADKLWTILWRSCNEKGRSLNGAEAA